MTKNEQALINHLSKGEFGKRRNDLIFMWVIGFLSGVAVFGLVLGVLYG